MLEERDNGQKLTIQELLKASLILSAYHSLCTLSMGMGLTCDDDIQEEMLSLIGPKALELAVVPKEHRSNRQSITN